MAERFTLEAALDAIDRAVSTAHEQSGLPPYLVGASLGGYLALEWAGRAADGRIAGVLAASCGTRPNRLLLDGWRLLARGIHLLPDRGRMLHELTVRAFVPQPGAADINAGGVALEVTDDVLRELRAIDPLRSTARIAAPVLFVNGRLDHFRVHERRMLAAAGQGRLVTIPRANHMVSVVRPDEFTATLLLGYRAVAAAAERGSEPGAAAGDGAR